MMCYYLNVHFQGQRVNQDEALKNAQWLCVCRNTREWHIFTLRVHVRCPGECLFVYWGRTVTVWKYCMSVAGKLLTRSLWLVINVYILTLMSMLAFYCLQILCL